MDATYLRGLKRAELQQLAKEYKVKANLKSDVIIDVLLQTLSESENIKVKNRSAREQLIPALEINEGPQTPRSARKHPRSISVGESRNHAVPDSEKDSVGDESFEATPAQRISATPPDGTYFGQSADATEVAYDPRHDIYYPDSPPDYSKREDLPADEDLIKETLEMMAVIDKDIQMFLERITKLRAAAVELRSRAKAVRELVRGEDFSRIRIMTYLTYWQPINDEWSYRDVWSGNIKIRHPNDFAGVTSSDEEDMEEVGDGQDAIRLQPNLPEQIDETIQSDNAVHLPSPPIEMDPVTNATTEIKSSNIVAGQKRLRELDETTDTELDDLRYTPRRRTEDKNPRTPQRKSRTINAELLEQLDRFSPPATPTPGRVDTKGKGRMTEEQVEKLVMERAAERFLAEIAAENLRLRPADEPFRLDSIDLTNMPQPFMELQANMRNVHLQNDMRNHRPVLDPSPAFSSAPQQPRSTRRSTLDRVRR